jgi:type I restriction enzyme S subunit
MARIKRQDGHPRASPLFLLAIFENKKFRWIPKISIGDVLYTCVGSYGNAAVVRRDDRFIFQRHIAQIKPDTTRLNPTFIAFCLETQELKRQADKVATGIAQKTVTLKGIKSFSVPVPPIQMQREFADCISPLNSVKSEQVKALSRKNALFSSLQHRAFHGEL